jgi:hypothetical protein
MLQKMACLKIRILHFLGHSLYPLVTSFPSTSFQMDNQLSTPPGYRVRYTAPRTWTAHQLQLLFVVLQMGLRNGERDSQQGVLRALHLTSPEEARGHQVPRGVREGS